MLVLHLCDMLLIPLQLYAKFELSSAGVKGTLHYFLNNNKKVMYSCLSKPISQTSPPAYSKPPAEASLATSCVRINSERGLHLCWRPSDTLSLTGGDRGRSAPSPRHHPPLSPCCSDSAAATHVSAQSSGTSSDMVLTLPHVGSRHL